MTVSPTTTQQQVDELNTGWEALGRTFDAYYDILPTKVQSTVKAALSNWQDFYYGQNFGADTYATADVNRWSSILTVATQTLKAAIPAGAKPPAPVAGAPAKRAKSDGTVFQIFGRAPSAEPTKLPAWWWWAFGAVPALAILYLTRKTGL